MAFRAMPHTPTMRPMVSNSRAGKSLRDLRVAEVVQLDLQLDAKGMDSSTGIFVVGAEPRKPPVRLDNTPEH